MSLLVMAALAPSLSESPPLDYHSQCEQPYECGDLQLYYPFWGSGRPRQCGADENLKLSCNSDEGYTYIEMGSQRFKVEGNVDAFENYYSVRLVPLGEADVCSRDLNYSLNEHLLLSYNQTVHIITVFYHCTSSYPDNYTLWRCGGGDVVYYNN
ncbi:hypothetical protein PIB30_114678, partial [Stylosanthes scabra]|nr:hypothetical protein [Stylosanthes scabra]